jgi:hypothetical protein
VDVIGTVKATAFLGDGSGLSNISGSVSGLNTGYITKASSATTINNSAIYQNGSNIGIGTTNPSSLLHVSGTGSIATALFESRSGSSVVDISTGAASSDAGVRFFSAGKTVRGIGIDPNTDNFVLGHDYNWISSMTHDFVINPSGNVGIGTTNPLTYKLYVNGDIHIPVLNSIGTGTANENKIVFHDADNGKMFFYTAAAQRMTINYSGNVGIGSTAPQAKLDVEGAVYVGNGNVGIGTVTADYLLHVNGSAAGISWTNLSDERFKTNIRPLEGSLEKVLLLRGVSYEWKAPTDPHMQGVKLGIIAQAVEKVYPQAVTEDSAGVKGVDYNALMAPLIEAIREQQEEIRALREEVEQLRQEVRDKNAPPGPSANGEARPKPADVPGKVKFTLSLRE